MIKLLPLRKFSFYLSAGVFYKGIWKNFRILTFCPFISFPSYWPTIICKQQKHEEITYRTMLNIRGFQNWWNTISQILQRSSILVLHFFSWIWIMGNSVWSVLKQLTCSVFISTFKMVVLEIKETFPFSYPQNKWINKTWISSVSYTCRLQVKSISFFS